MTTNPTPLTAHDVELLVRGYDVPVKPEESERRDYLMDTFIHMDNREVIEAYAAQHNAELVAENERLKNESMDVNIRAANFSHMMENLQAENERLKAESFMLREALKLSKLYIDQALKISQPPKEGE